MSNGEVRLLAAGCPLDQAEPYGDCLTYGPGHYETWARWRRDRQVDPALRAIVRSYDRTHRNAISFAGGAHRDPKRLALSEHRDAEWARNMIHAPLLVADLY
jgi:hypothetical protein